MSTVEQMESVEAVKTGVFELVDIRLGRHLEVVNFGIYLVRELFFD